MAIVENVFVTGTVGNLVFYRRMGKSCSRIKRDNIHQTESTKKRGINFGIAARAGKGLRPGLQNVMPFPKNRNMQSRFSGAIAKWLALSDADKLKPFDKIEALNGFQFTNGATFLERFKVPMVISRTNADCITVSIDAFIPCNEQNNVGIKAPANTVSIELTITVASCILQTGSENGSKTFNHNIPFNNKLIAAQVINFNVPMPAASITVTAARLQYNIITITGIKKTDDAAWTPAGIIDARYR